MVENPTHWGRPEWKRVITGSRGVAKARSSSGTHTAACTRNPEWGHVSSSTAWWPLARSPPSFAEMVDDLGPRLQRSLGDAFTLERELGGGGTARVYLASDAALDRRVVVKVLDLEGAVAASDERFRREVKVIAKL